MFYNFLDKKINIIDKKLLLMIMLAVVFALGFIDYMIGPEISFSVFYTAPIMLTVWYGHTRQGIFLAFISAGVWMAADIAATGTYSNYLIPLWNTLVRLSFFIIILHLIHKFKERLSLEENLADTDSLTGLANRRSFIEQLEQEQERVKRYPEPYTLTYLDLDNFKYINDTFGHDIGDKLLETVSTYLKDHIRDFDIAARLGGDEFALLFPQMKAAAAIKVLKEHQNKLLNLMENEQWPVTFSIGAITFNQNMNTLKDTIKAVDELMYSVKNSGKNNIILHEYPNLESSVIADTENAVH